MKKRIENTQNSRQFIDDTESESQHGTSFDGGIRIVTMMGKVRVKAEFEMENGNGNSNWHDNLNSNNNKNSNVSQEEIKENNKEKDNRN